MKQNSQPKHGFNQRFTIDSKAAYQSFLKYRPKFFSALRVHFQYSHSLGMGAAKRPKHDQLVRIAERSKGLRSLDITDYDITSFTEPSHTFEVIKSFRDLQSVQIPCYYTDKGHASTSLKWLRTAKRLKDFKSSIQPSAPRTVLSALNQSIHQKFYKGLQNSKLETIELSPFYEIISVPLFKQLHKLKKITLDTNTNHSPLHLNGIPTYNRAFSFLMQLKVLEISIPMRASVVIGLLNSIVHPENVTCLEFNLNEPNWEDRGLRGQLQKAFSTFSCLEKFSLHNENPIIMLEVLESLQEKPIEELGLTFRVKKEELYALGAFIGRLTGLRVLKLAVTSSLQHAESDLLITLLRSFSQLSYLQSLDLRMDMKRSRTDAKIMKGVLSAFAKTISCLGSLQELSFKFNRGDYSCEFQDLLGGLSKIAGGMKRLELDFAETKLEAKELVGMMETLGSAKPMEVLTLRGLVIADQKVLEALANLLLGLKKLRSLDLNEIIMEMENEMFLEMLQKICVKKGLERMKCTGTMMVKNSGENLLEMIKNIPYLDLLKVSSEVWKFILKDERFFNYKWE